jgi:hypothetical protein
MSAMSNRQQRGLGRHELTARKYLQVDGSFVLVARAKSNIVQAAQANHELKVEAKGALCLN